MPKLSKNQILLIKQYLEQYKDIYGNIIYYGNIKPSSKLEQDNSKNNSPNINLSVNKNIQALQISMFRDSSNQENALFQEDFYNAKSIEELYELIKDCQKCPLSKTRTNFVFGAGNPNADIMIIGEAPGQDEDLQGLPFVGRAGQLLTKILESINIKREDVFIANILKCRPPKNRVPLPSEIECCEPYLKKQIELIKPKIILVLGLTAAQTLLKSNFTMAETRGKTFIYQNTILLITYHPAALLRNPHLKKIVWEDMKQLRKMYDELINRV